MSQNDLKFMKDINSGPDFNMFILFQMIVNVGSYVFEVSDDLIFIVFGSIGGFNCPIEAGYLYMKCNDIVFKCFLFGCEH